MTRSRRFSGSSPVRLGFPLICCLVAGCFGRGSNADRVYRIEGADAAWNATRMIPGRALYKSQPIWEVEARPGDVLGLRILDSDEESAFGFDAQIQGHADLYYTFGKQSATRLEFSRRGPLFLLGETVVAANLTSKDAREWFDAASREERRSLCYLYIEEMFASFREHLKELNHPHLILRIDEAFAVEKLESMNLYGLVCADYAPLDNVSTTPHAFSAPVAPPPPQPPTALPSQPRPESSVPEAIQEPKVQEKTEAHEERARTEEVPFFDVRPLQRMKSLRFLFVGASIDAAELSGLEQLVTLRLGYASRSRHLEALSQLPSLEAVALLSEEEYPSVDLAPLAGIHGLSSLSVSGTATGLESIHQELSLIGFPINTTDEQFQTFLQRNPETQSLELNYCNQLTSLKPLEGLDQLHSLYVCGLDPGCDLRPIGLLESLNLLTVIETESTGHFAAFGDLRNLRRLMVDLEHLDDPEVVALKAALPDCDVVGYCMGSFWIVIALILSFVVGNLFRRHASRRSC